MRALVISGGGCKGAFAVGAIDYLLEQDHHWEIIVGTSTGSLIAPLLACNKFQIAKELYGNIHTKDLIKKHCWLTLPWRSSLYDDSGLRKVINDNYTKEIHEFLINDAECPDIFVCTANLNDGKLHYWSPRDTSREEFCRALSASSNQPGLMPPIQIRDTDYHVDGGVREIVPVAFAVEIGAVDITAIVLSSGKLQYSGVEYDRLPKILLRTLDLMTSEIRENDILRNDVKLSIIRPEDSLIDNSLRFNPTEMREMMKKGYEAAKNAHLSKAF